MKNRIGKYEIITELGRGAMGVVYKARDPLIGRFVAIKTMSLVLREEPELRQRFYQEMRAAGNLQHPNVVTIYEAGEWEGFPYIAMEFIEGSDLAELIRSKAQLPLLRKLEIGVEICKGLQYAHEHGVIHRDIKPANIRITPDGMVKIVDFGVARIAASTLTHGGGIVGTASYMSPEQIKGGQADARSDLFSVGIVLYELLTYRNPFEAESLPAVALKILTEDPPPLSSYLNLYPPALESVIRKALAKDPQERYQSARELAEALRDLIIFSRQAMIPELVSKAEQLYRERKQEAAREALLKALAIDDGDKSAKDLFEKLQLAEKTMILDQQSRALLQDAHKLMAEGDLESALDKLKQALLSDPQNAEALKLIDQIEAAMENKKRQLISAQHLTEAKKLLQDGDLAAAEQAAARALEADAANLEAKSLLEYVGKERQIKQRKERAEALIAEARLLLLEKSLAEALKKLEEARSLDPADAVVGELIGLVGQELEAEQRRKRADSCLEQARDLLARKLYADALKVLQQAKQIYPQDQETNRLLALAKEELRLAKRNKYVEEQQAAAKRYIAEKRYNEAIELLKRALDEVPEEPRLNELLQFAREAAEFAKLQMFRQEQIAKARGMIKRKKYRQAIKLLQRMAKEFPDEPEVAGLLKLAVRGEQESKGGFAVEGLNLEDETLKLDWHKKGLSPKASPPQAEARTRKRIASYLTGRLIMGIASVSIISLAILGFVIYRQSKGGQLSIDTDPQGATIFLGENEVGKSPLRLERLPAGKYTVKAIKEGYNRHIQEIEVLSHKMNNVKIALQPMATSKPSPGLSAQIAELRQRAEEAMRQGRSILPESDSALFYCNRILELDPGNRFALETKNDLASRYRKLAEEAYAKGDWAEAQEGYKNLAAVLPDDETVREKLAEVTTKLKREKTVEAVIREIELAIRKGDLLPPDPDNALDKVNLLQRLGRYDYVKQFRDKIKEALRARAEKHISGGDWEAARVEYEALLRHFPTDVKAQSRLEFVNKTIESLRGARQARPQGREPASQSKTITLAHKEQGIAAYKAKDYDKAISELSEAARSEPESYEVHFYLASAYKEKKQFDKAIASLEKCTSLSPNQAQAWLDLGLLYETYRQDFVRAQTCLAKARSLGSVPDYPAEKIDKKLAELSFKAKLLELEGKPLAVEHRHSRVLGSSWCKGELSVSAQGIRFRSHRQDKHGFAASLAEVKVSSKKGLYEFKTKDGDYDIRCLNASDNLFLKGLLKKHKKLPEDAP